MRRDIRGKEERVKDTMRMKLENATTEIRKKKECKEIGWVKEKKANREMEFFNQTDDRRKERKGENRKIERRKYERKLN